MQLVKCFLIVVTLFLIFFLSNPFFIVCLCSGLCCSMGPLSFTALGRKNRFPQGERHENLTASKPQVRLRFFIGGGEIMVIVAILI